MPPGMNGQLIDLVGGSPHRDIARVMRGYDTQQVNELLEHLDSELDRRRDQLQALQQELDDARGQIQQQQRPAHSGVASRIEELLRIA